MPSIRETKKICKKMLWRSCWHTHQAELLCSPTDAVHYDGNPSSINEGNFLRCVISVGFFFFSDLLLHLLIHKTTRTKYLADLQLLRFKLNTNLNIKHCSLIVIHLFFGKYVFPLARFLKDYLTFPISLGKLILLK